MVHQMQKLVVEMTKSQVCCLVSSCQARPERNWQILRHIHHLKGVVLDAGPGERGQVLSDGLPEERLVPSPRDHAHADERRQQRRAAQPHVRRERVEPQQAVQVE